MKGPGRTTLAGRTLAHLFRELHPFEVQAALLKACNLRCSYCRCPELRTSLLDTAQWFEVIRGLRKLGTLRIKFQGGEPTLRADFRELSRETKRLGMRAAVVTNGIPISRDPSLLDFLDEVVVSLDSTDAERNDRFRAPGSHRGATRTIELARERGLRTAVNMVVTRENFDEVPSMLEFCEARGVLFHAQPVGFDLSSYDPSARQFALTDEEIRELSRRLAEWKRERRGILFSAHAYERASRWGDFSQQNLLREEESRCMAGRFYVHIEPNGDVHPCSCIQGFRPKNVVRDGLEEALRHARHHHCADCPHVYLNERKLLFSFRPGVVWKQLAGL
ncbi:MAG: hypothetical protein KatS3mg076_1953 [Candidatus Binatia bacterium]|nr:MAG: hypothetical protein KatS3mg076_1953 [Candidatus Binatia bacterium]